MEFAVQLARLNKCLVHLPKLHVAQRHEQVDQRLLEVLASIGEDIVVDQKGRAAEAQRLGVELLREGLGLPEMVDALIE